jgi:pyridine nucleotide-disulfide oxidoreductase family protein
MVWRRAICVACRRVNFTAINTSKALTMTPKRLVLLGGGHAHVHVLKALIGGPFADTEVILITPFARQVYSGMLPGWIAGHYQIDDCVIPLAPLARAANVQMIEASAVGLDTASNLVHTDVAGDIAYDVLSIDIGSVPNIASMRGDVETAITIRPIERFITKIEHIVTDVAQRHAQREQTSIVVIGGGAGGIEVTLALKNRFKEAALIHLISGANTLPPQVNDKLMRALANAGVTVHANRIARTIANHEVQLDNGDIISARHVITALGAMPAAWLAKTGLHTDAAGYMTINRFLQSTSHANIFAAGDCASIQNQPRPKSGVYAVRAGPPLIANLRAFLAGTPLQTYTPQRRALYLIATGRKHAIGLWGSVSWSGVWVWRWKDRIDRAFIARYRL